MRKTEASGLMVRSSSSKFGRTLRLSAVALGVGLLMTSGVARAQDNDDDDQTFEEKIVEGIMKGLGGTNMDNTGIDYRERSPLVVPPKLDLPPPTSASAEVNPPNWPKDPDEAARKARKEARKKDKPQTPWEAARLLTPSELNKGRTASSSDPGQRDPMQPGSTPNPMLSPSQLGFDGKFSSLFGGNKEEKAEFKGEPPREALTQPPAGYQTPSPNYAYGTGPLAPLGQKHFDIMSGTEK